MDVDLIVLINQIPATTFIDYLGVVMGVLAGALFAIERKLDVVGVVSLGIITGFGGGIIRDLLLQDQGIFFMEHPIVILASIFICIAMSTARRRLVNFYSRLFYIDAFTMAWYALAGASKSWFAGTGPVICVILGSITAVGGSALRDICVGEVPRVFQPGKFYAVSSFIGAAFYAGLLVLKVSHDVASVLCVAVGFGLTILSKRFNWHTHGGTLSGRGAKSDVEENG